MENEKPKGGGMEKLASFIVDKRNLFFLLYIFALIFSAIATGWVKVEDDITTYLPDTTETRQGLTVMNDNFVTYGTANVMVSNITYDTALDIQSRLEDIEGVTTVEFDDTDEHYTNASALFSVSFDAEVGDERAENALQEIRDELEGSYDTSIYSEVGYDSSADLQSEMLVIVIIAAIIIVVVLTLTSRSYAEVPVLLMTFGAAALLNMGTNFLCGTISFISNSVTVILQLALVLLCALFSAVKTAFLDMPNAAGMEANAVLAANGLVMLGIFNAVFFPPYFREPEKIGKPFVIGAVALFLFVAAVTACCFAVPFVRDVLDTPDPEHFGAKLIYLAAAALIYAALTSFSALRSMKNFEKTDL